MKTISHLNRFLVPALTLAAPFIASAQGQDLLTPIANNMLALVRVLVLIVFVLAVVAFGWGIVKFIFAGGDPTTIGKAKTFLLWGVIGMAVMASLFGLITFMQDYFGLESGGLNVETPKVQ